MRSKKNITSGVKFCECGCGQMVKADNRFIQGHSGSSRNWNKIRNKIAWNKGLTKETDERVAKYSKTMTGQKFTEERLQNWKSAVTHKSGSEHYNWKPEKHIFELRYCACGCGQTFECTIISKQKFIHTHNGRGKFNGCYVDGSARKKYYYFTKELKNKIRMRNNQKCVLCGKTRIDQILEQYLKNKRVYELHAHHVDYDKTNCSESNLITLCHSCHPKTNTNRTYWQKLFTEGMGSSRSHGIIGV